MVLVTVMTSLGHLPIDPDMSALDVASALARRGMYVFPADLNYPPMRRDPHPKPQPGDMHRPGQTPLKFTEAATTDPKTVASLLGGRSPQRRRILRRLRAVCC